MASAVMKGVVAGILAAFTAIGGQYLYASNRYATIDQVAEIKTDLKQDIRDGFDRIEKSLDRIRKP